MKQQCPVAFIYLSWVVYAGGLFYFAFRGEYIIVAWLILVPVAQWAYIRFFPRISRYLGYGRVDDEPPGKVSQATVNVTFYSALGCPFYSIVEKRREALQKEMGFTLKKLDVTL